MVWGDKFHHGKKGTIERVWSSWPRCSHRKQRKINAGAHLASSFSFLIYSVPSACWMVLHFQVDLPFPAWLNFLEIFPKTYLELRFLDDSETNQVDKNDSLPTAIHPLLTRCSNTPLQVIIFCISHRLIASWSFHSTKRSHSNFKSLCVF